MTVFGPPTAWSLKALIEKSLRKHADRTALHFEDHSVRYRELDRATNAVANELVARGLEPEDRMAVAMTNRVEFTVAEIAAIKAGAAPVKINYMFSPAEVEQRLDIAGASAAICGPGFVDDVHRLTGSLEALETVIAVPDEGQQLPNGVDTLADLVDAGDDRRPPDLEVDPDAIARIVFTGGTTGEPKPVVYTHRTISARNYATFVEADLSSDDTTLTTTVLARAGGAMLFSGLIIGAENVLQPGFDEKRVLQAIDERGVTWAFLVPTMLYRLLDHPELDEYDLSSLRTVLYGASPITRDRLRAALERFGPVFIQAYGQVETPMFITTLGKHEHRLGLESGREALLESAGQPGLMADVRIVDVESDEPVAPGEAGEILAKAPYSMAGYLDRPEATDAKTLDGWIRTGDIGRRDEAGYLYILDRKSNVIITGGLNVYTTEVEDVVADHPGVKEVAVIGVPHDDWGEAVTAVVVPDEPGSLSEADLAAYAEDRLADYKEPKRYVFLDEMPLTPAGKVDKAALRGPYWQDEGRQVH